MHSSGLWQCRLSQVRFGFLAWMLCCCVCAFGPGGPQHLCSCEQKTTQHVLKHSASADVTQSSRSMQALLTSLAGLSATAVNGSGVLQMPAWLCCRPHAMDACPCRCWHWHVHHRGGVSGPAAARFPAAGDRSPAAGFCRSRWVWPATAFSSKTASQPLQIQQQFCL